MREPENLRQIAALEPDFVGLIFYQKSPRFVSPENAARLLNPATLRRIGVFVNESAKTILETALRAKLFAIQLHGDESPEFCREVKERNGEIKIIKAFAIDENFDSTVLQQYETICDYFLFDTKTVGRGGSGREFDWQILRRFEIKKPFFLSGGIGAENISEAIAACDGLPLFAVDVNSRAEIAAGVKSAKIVREIIEKLTAEEPDLRS